MPKLSRRKLLQGTTALAATTVFASPSRAQAPAAEPVTPALIEAAKKEGKVVWYTSVDLPLSEKVGKAFEAKYPGISVRVERSGAERVFQRIGQEYSSKIYAVDVVNSSDAAHMIVWKRDGWLGALRAGGCRQALPRRAQGPGRPVRELPRHAQRDRLQHQPGEARGRAEELRRPARSEMGGQDHEGASGLQRHDPDRDLPDIARSRLGVFREARQAARHAASVGVRSAEEAFARRARHHGRRHRVSRAAAEGGRQSGRAGLCRPKARR